LRNCPTKPLGFSNREIRHKPVPDRIVGVTQWAGLAGLADDEKSFGDGTQTSRQG